MKAEGQCASALSLGFLALTKGNETREPCLRDLERQGEATLNCIGLVGIWASEVVGVNHRFLPAGIDEKVEAYMMRITAFLLFGQDGRKCSSQVF